MAASSSPSSSPSSYSRNKKFVKASMAIADMASWCCAFVILGLILVASVRDDQADHDQSSSLSATLRGSQYLDRPCDEIYVVREGETLHTISDKCGDPFIVERNPHIHDPDDVFPGLVIKITPTKSRKALR
ncbi:uncharacterized protein LOC116194174 [Punica granatum]|uniref:LysM domain-containing protein n=2 Tax=Punica granatum TaxID=22663 RepID=A0A218WT23_PUNGR|nr:uncharacterized protein LOC116194174 [Punica granatum]OWM75649.1 hypothetical protein CDL15_Pgr021814 [Punica granatum]PKI38350.1 hypothetical protein CRG98_041261 [Punica granatum]